MLNADTDTNTETGPPPRSRWITTLFLAAAAMASLLVATALGAFLPGIPLLGMIGSGLAGVAGWLTILAVLVAAALAVALWKRRSAPRAAFAGVGALGVLTWVAICAQLLVVGIAHGQGLNLFALPVEPGTPDHVVDYLDEDHPVKLAVWEPRNADGEITRAGGAPVALFVHGGGWIYGDEMANSADKLWFAERGWLVLSASYTLSNETQHLGERNYDEITCAMSWAQEHAGEYGGEPATFAMLGDSAGGNLAISAAYQAAAGTAEPACAGTLPEVDAVATVYPAVDPVSFHDNKDLGLPHG